MRTYSKAVSTKRTPQSRPIPNSKQKENNAGGYAWEIDKWKQLQRFLILGTEGGTYYVKEQKLTEDNCASLIECIKEDGVRVLNETVKISDEGRAIKNDPAIFVIALLLTYGDRATKQEVVKHILKVCRIGTHILTLASNIKELRSFGRVVRHALGSWYNGLSADNLVYQITKYFNRSGWTHADILNTAHIKPISKEHQVIFNYIINGYSDEIKNKNEYIDVCEKIKEDISEDKLIKLIQDYKLPREVIPTNKLNSIKIWDVLLDNMPLTALIRNLGKMTKIGLLGKGKFDSNKKVIDKLSDKEYLYKSRIHPLSILMALKTYSGGHGLRGSLNWEPVQTIVDILDDAFYVAFKNVEPINKKLCLALDISSSMSSPISGLPISCAEASGALALITASVEKNYEILGFAETLKDLYISPNMRLDDVMKKIEDQNFGGTDCALPMLWAIRKQIDIDAFVVYTDSETWCGNIHPSQALQQYRHKMNKKNAKLIVVGMASNSFTIADPKDSNMMDVVGFNTEIPQVISEFIKE